MKLLTAQQIKDWDKFTINREPVKSIDLMERAANACVNEIVNLLGNTKNKAFKIFCGLGNNGGDGLAIARLLYENGFHVEVFIIEYSKDRSDDFKINEKKLANKKTILTSSITGKSKLPFLSENDIVIDAIFGTGLNKNIDGLVLKVVQHINQNSEFTIAIDVPSGLKSSIFSDDWMDENKIIHASHTFTFQIPKMSFMHAETYKFVGEFHILDIGLHTDFFKNVDSNIYFISKEDLPKIKQRNKFSHKGNFGHAICIGGSYGKMGASVLMSRACLKAGVGLVTSFVPKTGYTILQTAFPEAMILTDDELFEIRNFPSSDSFDAVGVGPGIGTNEFTSKAFYKWISSVKIPCVIDADALNICSNILLEHHSSFHFPANTILTPHPKEFDRLAGISANSFERIEKQIHFAKRYNVIVILKGAHTSIALPDARLFFNSSGNPKMATAGSGDVLTGIITSLLAQGHETQDAAVLGVYLHGKAGDIAAENKSTIIASDIIEAIPFVK